MNARYVEPSDDDLRNEAVSDSYAVQREIREYEFSDSAADQRWERWVTETERLLGHVLDGDQQDNGYSLDEAYELWSKPRLRGEQRITPEQYARRVRSNLNYKPDPGDVERFRKARR